MAQSSGNRDSRGQARGSQQRQRAQSGQNGGRNSYINQNPNYGYPQNPPRNQPYQPQSHQYTQGAFTQRGTRNQTTGLTPAQKKERLRRKQELLKRRRRNRRLLYAFLVLFFIFVGYMGIRALNGSSDQPTDAGLDPVDLEIDEEAEEEAYTGPPITTISFVGDISTSEAQIAAVTRSDGTYDFASVFLDVEEQILKSDYAVASFETTMIEGQNYGVEPYYNSPVQLAGTLRSLGFRLVSTANTYMLNNGIEGLTATRQALSQANLKAVGTYLSQEERDENGGAYVRDIHGIRFAFLSYTKGTESVRMPDGCEYALNTLYSDYSDYWTDLKRSQIRSDIQAAKDAGAEVIVALVHWGSEYGRSITEQQETVADLLLGNGVDVIVGTHSHVVNEMEFRDVELSDGTRKTCFVAYGLGDFYTDPEKESGQTSVILNLTFERNDEGLVTITDAGYVPIYQNISDASGTQRFEVLDTYKNIASLYRADEITSTQALLYNQLLDSVDTLYDYVGEEYDAGPADEDLRVVRQAIEAGPYSNAEIRAMLKKEKAAAKEAGGEEEPEVDPNVDTGEEAPEE